MGPVANGAVAKDHQNAEEHVNGDGADGDKPEIGGEVEDSDGHRVTAEGRRVSVVRSISWYRRDSLGFESIG